MDRYVADWCSLLGIGLLACSGPLDATSGTKPAATTSADDVESHAASEVTAITASASASQSEGHPPDSNLPLGPLPTTAVATATADAACASATAAGELQPLALAFAFDVSGSMGKGDKPYHDKALKWDPVVSASRAFFEATSMPRVGASLIFFPAEDDRCEVASYAQPDVELQPLPSDAFQLAIDAVTPAAESDWRGGTPTLAVLEGTAQYVRELLDAGSTAKHAIVLVTDGTPQGCSDADDSVDAVADAAAALSNEIPIYVIGIANPATDQEPNPPDNVTSLNLIAERGGTQQAFLIDTGDPAQTIAAFDEVIQTIRKSGLSCVVPVPEPPSGMTFDQEKVNVSLSVDGAGRQLVYSPACDSPGAWHFDDAQEPSRIILCDDTCEQSKSAGDAALQVEFGCERRTNSVR